MKIKSIAAICKKNKNIAIFERYSDDGDILTQYIGDGSAVYPVVGLPQLDKESLLTIFDVPEKDRDNYFVKTLGVPAGISFEDTDETERHVEREGISIIYSGRTLKPIRTTRGLVFIESRYLSPVADVLDVLELYERRTAEGTPNSASCLIRRRPTRRRNALCITRRKRTGFRKAGIAAARYSAIRLTDARSASGFKRLSRKRGGGVSDCFTYPSADRHSIFSRLHLRESGNPLRARAATVHGRRRERRRSRALPVNGSYL